jgi:hypothetical protein
VNNPRKFDEDNPTIFDVPDKFGVSSHQIGKSGISGISSHQTDKPDVFGKSYVSGTSDVSGDQSIIDVYEGIKLPEDLSDIIIDLYYEGNKIIIPKEHTVHINEYINLNIDNFKYIPILEFDEELFANTAEILPISWVSNILRYIKLSVPWQLTPMGLLVNLESQVDPTDTLSGIYDELITTLSNMYYAGYIYRPPLNIIKNWDIKPIGSDGLFKIEFSDKFLRGTAYTSPVDFILSRIYGMGYIDYEIGDNVLIRHMVAKVLNGRYQITMIGDNVRVRLETYDSAIKVMNDINDILNTTYPDTRIDVAPLASIEDDLTDDITDKDYVIYSTDDVDRPWYLSIITDK